MAQASNFLKLVGHDDPHVVGAWQRDAAARAIAQENRAASRAEASLEPTDPRWILAARTYASLEGSTLTPEKRARLQRTAERIGVRPFDANVIIAIVQDQARRGESIDAALPTLNLLENPAPTGRRREQSPLLWIAAMAGGVVAAMILIRWFIGN